MESNNLSQVDWLTPQARQSVDLPLEIIVKRRDLLSAILLCVEVSGLDDKQIYGPLKIDAAQWSRIRSGKMNFPLKKLGRLMDVCGNEIPLTWQAFERGYELKPLRSSLERQLEEARRALLDKDRELEAIKQFVKDTQ